MTLGRRNAERRTQKSESRQSAVGILPSGIPSLRSAIGDRLSAVLATAILVASATVLPAQVTNPAPTNVIPPLRPPKPEIQPGFWETNGLWMTLLGIAVLVAGVLATRLLLRPKPPVVPEPAKVARDELRAIQSRPEDDALLNKVSTILRTYLISAFALPHQAFTHSELCAHLLGHPNADEEFCYNARRLLDHLEHRRFDSRALTPAGGIVKEAMRLVDQAESCRQSEPTAPGVAGPDA